MSCITPERILQLGMGFWGAKTLLSAVELGLFTELAEEPLRGDVLAERLKLHQRGWRDFLDVLVALGMLRRAGWMREVGFGDVRVEHLAGPDSMVIGVKTA